MEPISQFGWAEVAGIAGAALVCLMGIVGILLGIILKRQGRGDSNGGIGQGLIGQVNQIQKSIDGEIVDRKADFKSLRDCISKNRLEEREDINTLHRKLETNVLNVVENFQQMCIHNQAKCADMQDVKITGVKEKIALTCKALDNLTKDVNKKWQAQERLNFECRKKIDA